MPLDTKMIKGCTSVSCASCQDEHICLEATCDVEDVLQLLAKLTNKREVRSISSRVLRCEELYSIKMNRFHE